MASVLLLCFRIVYCFLFLWCYFLFNKELVFAQSPTAYACDVSTNPGLSSFTFCDKSLDVQTRVNDLIKRLTLQEKVTFLVDSTVGVSRLGIPKYEWWSEALHGLSYTGPGTHFNSLVPGATSFPQVIHTAASFNVTLFQTIGKVLLLTFLSFFPLFLACSVSRSFKIGSFLSFLFWDAFRFLFFFSFCFSC